MKNTATGEQLIRSVLRRRREECLRGAPGSDPGELGDLIQAYWDVLSHARKQLLRAVRHRAAVAYRGFDYQGAEDVLHDSLVKACELLVAQYNGEDTGFVFDTEDRRSIVSWVTAVVGAGFGPKAGVFGTHLQRERREAARFLNPGQSEGEEEAPSIASQALIIAGGVDPARLCEAREALVKIASHLEALEPERRFAVETLLLFRALCDDDAGEFWVQVERLTGEIWDDTGRMRPLAVVTKFREHATGRLTIAYVMDMIKALVDRSHKQLGRWYEAFVKEARGLVTVPALGC